MVRLVEALLASLAVPVVAVLLLEGQEVLEIHHLQHHLKEIMEVELGLPHEPEEVVVDQML